ncbi:MAG TPA: hypothetical protein VHW24_12860 [Bryobacteraceae bacterium]|nr:hypothetical protein [Bryobacteraceae bacterium]
MKTALILVLSCASLSFAQNMKLAPQTQAKPSEDAAPQTQTKSDAPQEFKRLASVTWDLNTHKLVWVVQKGPEVNGEFVPQKTDRYEVSPTEAFMAMNEEKRDIGADEADSLHELLSVLSLYCVKSTVWWEANGAEPTSDPSSAPSVNEKPGKKTGDGKIAPVEPGGAKPARSDQQQSKPLPAIPGTLIAANGVVK